MNPSSPISQSSYAPIITTQQALNNAALHGSRLPRLIVPDGEEGTPEHDSKLDSLFAQIHASLWQRGQGHDTYARNPLSNYRIFKGQLSAEDHDDILTANFAPGLQRLADYSFFSENESILNGMMQQAGLKFSLVSKGPKWEAQRREQVAMQGAEDSLRMMNQMASQQMGTDLSGALTDESIHVPTSDDEWNANVTMQQQLESEIFERLNEANQLTNTESKLLDCFRDKFIVNCEIAYVTARNGQPEVEPLTLDQVSFWGKADAKTAEDMDAWAVRRTLTLSQLVAKWGSMLEKSGDFEEILQALGGLGNGGMDTLMRRYRDGQLNQLLDNDRPPYPVLGNGNNGLVGDVDQVVEQHVFVRLLQPYYFMLLTDVETDGSPCAQREMTKEEMTALSKGRYAHFERIIYERISREQYKQAEKAGATSLHLFPVAVMYDSVRLGEKKILFRRISPSQEREPGRISTPKFPIVAHFGRDTSMVTKGKQLHEMYTNCMILLRKKVALSGIKAVMIDTTLMPKGYTHERWLWEIKEAGALYFNGQRVGGQQTKESISHGKTIDLSMDSDLTPLFTFAVALKDMYDRQCGITSAMKAQYQSRETQGQTQLSLAQGSLATARHFYEHSQFSEEVLSRMVSEGKYVWPRSQQPRARGATLETVGNIPINYYGVYLEDTIKMQQDKDFIMQLGMQGISSGSVSLGEVIRMHYSENSVEVLNIFENGLTAMQKMQADQQQQSAQIAQMQTEINQAKAQMPATVANINRQSALEVEQLRQGGLGQRNENDINFKQDKSDVDAEHDIKKTLIQQAGQQGFGNQTQGAPTP